MTIKLEVGKQYVLNNGEVHTCYSIDGPEFKIDRRWYDDDGRCLSYDHDHPLSVSHEYTPQEGTLAELGVNEGDVVELVDWRLIDYSEHIGKHMIGRADGGVFFDDEDGFCKSVPHIFRLISRASDTPTLWRDMTPEEKGALLLAEHEGEDIQVLAVDHDCSSWVKKLARGFLGQLAYRIKPTPKVETVALCWRHDVENVKNKIGTIDLIDGEPSLASIKPDPQA